MPGPLSFDWQDPNALVAQLRSVLQDANGRIRRVPERAIKRGAFELLRLIQQKAPKKTGTLVRSLHVVVEKITEDLIEGRVGTWLEYARYLEEGTGIHGPKKRPISIVPKGKKALFWGAYDAGGKALVRKRVLVKGIKPVGYFAEAIAEFLPRYVRILEEELAKEIAA